MIEQYENAGNGELNSQTYQLAEEPSLSYFQMAFGRFPPEMLYNIQKDPYCLNNLADDPKYQKVKERLSTVLTGELKQTQDPRLGNTPNVWNSYRRYGTMRRFPRPDWAQ